MASLPLLLLLLLSFLSFSAAHNNNNIKNGGEYCAEKRSLGERKADECYSVDSITCRTQQPNGCLLLEGTFDYFLSHGRRRHALWTMLVTAQPCSGTCTVTTVQEADRGESKTYECSVEMDGTIRLDGNQAAAVFGAETQQFVFEKGYPKVENDLDNCESLLEEEFFLDGRRSLLDTSKDQPNNKVCTELPSYGARNEEECYSVDSTSCVTDNYPDGCNQLEGTYQYYLTKGGAARVNLWTVLVAANVCTGDCMLMALDHNSVTRTVDCVANSDGSIGILPGEDTSYVFGEDIQEFQHGEEYPKLRNDLDYCTYLSQSDEPSIVDSLGPSMVPSSLHPSTVPSSLYPSSSLVPSDDGCYQDFDIAACYDGPDNTLSDMDCDAECHQVDISICIQDQGEVCVEIQASYDYGEGNPNVFIETSVGCLDDPSNYYCLVTVGEVTCNRCLVDTQNDPTNVTQVITVLDCSDYSGWGLPEGNQTIFLSEGVGYLQLREEISVCHSDAPSIVPSSEGPSMQESLVPSPVFLEEPQCYQDSSIPGCYDPSSPTTVIDCVDCYDVDIQLCTRFYSSGCEQVEGIYHYGEGNQDITITTYRFCDNRSYYCEVRVGDAVCEDCVIYLDIGQSGPSGGWVHHVTVGESCSDVLGGYLPPETQSLPFFTEGVGYLRLAKEEAVCRADSAVPSHAISSSPSSVPSLRFPSSDEGCYKDYDIAACSYHGTLSEEDCERLAECHRVDVSICQLDQGDSCIEYQASYDYGKGNPDVFIQTSVGCLEDPTDDYCLVTVGGVTCNRCLVDTMGDDTNAIQVITVLDCSDQLGWGLPPGNQTIWLSEGAGYLSLREDISVCVSEVPSIALSTSYIPSNDPSLSPPSTHPSNSEPPSFVPSTSASQFPSGGYFSCYDSLADGVPNDGNCYAVDIGICYERFPWNGGCTHAQATYEYYNINANGNRERYGYVYIPAVWNCGDEDGCAVAGCGGCAVLGDTIALEGCNDFFLNASQTLRLIEGGGYPKIANKEAMCNHPAILPSRVPSMANSLDTRSAGNHALALSPKSKDTIVLQLKPHLTLRFFAGHEEEEPPEASEILALLDRTEAYFQEILLEDFGLLLKSIQLQEIQHTYLVQPHHQFELSFTAHITLDAAAIVQKKAVADLLSERNNLQRFVGEYARYADEDGSQANGLFYQTSTVRARVVGVAVVNGGMSK